MDTKFLAHVEALKPLLHQLLKMQPVKPDSLPEIMPTAGVYLLSEDAHHLYVGRSNHIGGRLGRHSKPAATHRMASFAYWLARETVGDSLTSSRKIEGGRATQMDEPIFAAAFLEAKTRIRKMDARFVEESNPTLQALLEIYVAMVLPTRYSDFDNH
ncbi:MAG: hypothetical protein ABI536_05370 [Gallionella sp.]